MCLRFRDILINFDDSLITKIHRETYKDVKGFLLMDDKKQLENLVVTPSNIDPIDNSQKQFATRKTGEPDVYDLFDNSNVFIGNAAVPTMKMSKKLRELFDTKNVVDRIMIPYEFSDKFGKFTPILS